MKRYVLCGLVIATIAASGIVARAGANNNASLIDAVKRGDTTAARMLVKSGADANTATSDGSTALHWAVHHSNRALVEFLLASGAQARAANQFGETPIALAVQNGDAVIIERLLKAGASASDTLPDGETPLLIAARTGTVEAIRVLLAHGAPPNVASMHGQTPLMWAASLNHAPAIKTLLEAGAKVDARSTAKPGAAAPGRREGAPVSGFTPLLFAVRAGGLESTRVLLDAGANVNDILSDGQNALVMALANARWDVADLLLDRGADPNHAGAGWNALHQAVRISRPNIGFGTPGPLRTGTIDNIHVIKKIIAKGVNINARVTTNGMTKDGQRNRLVRPGSTAFFLAAKNTDTELMRLLLAAGADPSIRNAELSTPLMVAAGLHIWNPGEDGGSLQGQEDEVFEAVKICIEAGNDVNDVNMEGYTALHGAAFRGAPAVAQYLLDKGAKIDAKAKLYPDDKDGWMPLAIANGISYANLYKDQLEVAAVLKKAMQARGLSVDGHNIPQEICLDCGTDPKSWQKYQDREKAAAEYMAKEAQRAEAGGNQD